MRRLEDRLFDRFRARADAQALAGVFDRTAPELLRVAVHLTGDRAAAEDLVQETFVLAIERAATFDGSRRVRPWLLGILANLVRRQRRAARPCLDLAERVALAGDPLDAAAGAELRASVVAAIEGTPPCYRQVLVLHLQHGLTAKEIAQVLDRPAGTVRTQVMRGLELLRKALPASLGAAASAAAPAGRGLMAVREVVVSRAAGETGAAAVGATAGVSAWMTVLGVWSMQKVLGVVAATAILAAATLATMLIVDAFEAAPPKDEPSALALRAGAVVEPPALDRPTRRVADRRPADIGAADVTEEEPLGIAPGLSVAGIVVDDAGAPVDGAVVLVLGPGDSERTELARTVADGGFEARDLQGDHVTLWARAAGRQPSRSVFVEGPPGSEKTVRLELGPRGHRLVGRVVDAQRRPVPQAWIGVGVPGNNPQTAGRVGYERAEYSLSVVEERADAAGAFDLDWVPAGSVRLFAQPPTRRPSRRASVEVRIEPSQENHAELQLSSQAAVVGTLRDSAGEPVAGVISAFFEDSTIDSHEVHDRLSGAARAGVDGAFRIEGLLPGPYRLFARAEARSVAEPIELAAGEERHWDPLLPVGAVAAVRVLDERGAPLAGWQVRWSSWSEVPGQTRHLSSVESAETGDDGSARAPGLEAGSYVVTVHGRMRTAVRSYRDWCPFPSVVRDQVAVPGGELELRLMDASRPSAPLSGRVLGPDGAPVAAQLSLWRDDWKHDRLDLAVDPTTGRFETGPLTPGSFRLGVGSRELTHITVHPVLFAEQPLDLGDLCLPAPAGLDVRLVVADGGTLSNARVLAGRDEWVADGHVLSAERDPLHWRSRPLLAGTWRVYAFADGMAPARCEMTLAAGEQRAVSLSLERGAPCELEIFLTEAGAVDGIANGVLRVRDGAGAIVVEERLFGYYDDLPRRLLRRRLCLVPGRYAIEAEDWDAQRRRAVREIDVGAAGISEPVRLRIE